MYYECISLHYDGNENMGIWLEMSGQGCRIFETFGNGDYETLFAMCADSKNEMHITRLDVAFDDFDGLLDINEVCRDMLDKNIVSRFNVEDPESNSWIVTYSGSGASLILGSPKSEIRIRIYDKDGEQGHIEGRHWVRVELQLRRDRALGFYKAAAETPSIGVRFRGVLADYVRFVTPTEDSNKRRWPTAPYWEKLLDGVQAISIYSKVEKEYTIDQLDAYVVHQAGNAIEAYISIRGVDGFLNAIKERGQKPNPKYDALKASLAQPVKERELTPEEIYAAGYDFVKDKAFDGIKQIRDFHGFRWLECEECGRIQREDEMVSYGGERKNYGICRKCSVETSAT